MGKTLDLSDIGGGKIFLSHECYNSEGIEEIFLNVEDFEEGFGGTAILEPRHARQLAQMLLEIADEAEHWED